MLAMKLIYLINLILFAGSVHANETIRYEHISLQRNITLSEIPALPNPTIEPDVINLRMSEPRIDDWVVYSKVGAWINLSLQLRNSETQIDGAMLVQANMMLNTQKNKDISCNLQVLRLNFPGLDKDVGQQAKSSIQKAVKKSLAKLPKTLCWPRVELKSAARRIQ